MTPQTFESYMDAASAKLNTAIDFLLSVTDHLLTNHKGTYLKFSGMATHSTIECVILHGVLDGLPRHLRHINAIEAAVSELIMIEAVLDNCVSMVEDTRNELSFKTSLALDDLTAAMKFVNSGLEKFPEHGFNDDDYGKHY